MKQEHQHLIVNGTCKNPIIAPVFLNAWFHKLVNLIDMYVLIPAHSVYCHDVGNRGVTGSVIITTSHASIHIWDETDPALFRFDLYSCKAFDENTVINYIDETMNIISYDYITIDRNGDPCLIKEKNHQQQSNQ